jgi:amino acid transporter
MAGNSISFAIRILEAANYKDVDSKNGAVRGIAIAISILACMIHAFSRRGGIWLNNLLAAIKVSMMLLIIVTTIVYSAGKFPKSAAIPDRGAVTSANLGITNSFANASTDPNSYAQAFLAIIFSFSGYEQPNYVLGEIGRPHRKYPIAMVTSVASVCVLYIVVNICYVSTIPAIFRTHTDAPIKWHHTIKLPFLLLIPLVDGCDPKGSTSWRHNRGSKLF